jgi:hypothetical protein
VSVALAAPLVSGLNVMVNGVLWPAGTVTGRERPPTLKTELLVLAAVTVTSAPLAVSVPEAVPLVPSITSPRAKVVGVTASCPGAAVPVPDTDSVVWASDALLARVTVALKLPVALGVNSTPRLTLWPTAMVAGRLGDIREKYLVETVALLIVRLAFPELVAVTVRVALLPAATLPKVRLPFARESVPLCELPVLAEFAALTPWQPLSKARLSRSSDAQAALTKYLGIAVVRILDITQSPFHKFQGQGGNTWAFPTSVKVRMKPM